MEVQGVGFECLRDQDVCTIEVKGVVVKVSGVGSRFRVEDFRFRTFEVPQGVGLRASGFGSRVWVWGSGSRILS